MLRILLVTGAAFAGVAASSYAQTWPAKPVRIIYPGAPGCRPQTIARMFQEIVGSSCAAARQIVHRALLDR